MTDQYKHTDLISCAVWSTLEAVALNFWPEFVGWKSFQKTTFWFHPGLSDACVCSPEFALIPDSVSKMLWVLGMSLRTFGCRLSGLSTSWMYKKRLHERGNHNILFKATGTLVNHHFFGSFRISSAVHQEFSWSLSMWLCVLASPHFDYIRGCGQKSGDYHSDENWYQKLLWRYTF